MEVSKDYILSKAPVNSDAIPLKKKPGLSLFIALYDKSKFENFNNFGAFCYSIDSIQQDWYGSKNIASAFEWYSPNTTEDKELVFSEWIAGIDVTHESLDTWIKNHIEEINIDWLAPNMIEGLYYSMAEGYLESKGIGQDYYLDMFITDSL